MAWVRSYTSWQRSPGDLCRPVIGAAIEVHVLILEFKVVEEVLPVHKAQLLSYMKLLNTPLGLLFNFHEVMLKNGITRMTL